MSELKNGDYVLATKYSDGSPYDHWAIGFYDGLLRIGPEKADETRHMVVDSEGMPFRRNGFRRVKRINAKRGGAMLRLKDSIDISGHSLWWWCRKPLDWLDKKEPQDR